MKTNFHDIWATSQLADETMTVVSTSTAATRRRVDYSATLHYHPYTDALIEQLNTNGLDALLDPSFLELLEHELAPTLYTPGAALAEAFPKHEIDVSDTGPYANYNWELLFHAPLIIAVHLSKSQRFAEAQRWFHYIFDPTCTDTSEPVPKRFWRFLRFRRETTPAFIAELLTALAKGEESKLQEEFARSIAAWRDEPFQPHKIARTRYLAYQLNVVMKYLDNLLAWGDSLFRQDTIETINEATQVYVLAANILGPRPQKIPQRRKTQPRSYAQLKAAGLDAFGNALVELENEFPFNGAVSSSGGGASSGLGSLFGIGPSLYFCIPRNEKLLEYWDKVADRLFKLRHCMNIEGVVRQLALFDPPIDPGALVRAAAAGLDIGSIVSGLNQPVSTLRGPRLLQLALGLCGELRTFGGALLAAIEKSDSEQMQLLRQRHELTMAKMVRETRFLQWKEAEGATEAVLASRATVFERYRHYKRILGASDSAIDVSRVVTAIRDELDEESFDAAYAALVEHYHVNLGREAYRKETTAGGLMEFAGEVVVDTFGGELGKTLPLNKNENAELNIYLPSSDTFSTASTILSIAAAVLGLIPQGTIDLTPLGLGGTTEFGGKQLSSAANYGADATEKVANAFRSSADRASRLASYYRRAEDYVLQANLATAELEQYGRQIISSLLREHLTKNEYESQLRSIEQIEEADAFLHDKFSNAQLYAWLQGELSRIYYDTYKLTFDVAKRAEQTLKYELMRPEFDAQQFIAFGYWDGARKGLVSGETLFLDLKRLELAHLEHSRREYELSKHVSLARLDPLALLELRATGQCEFTVPEWLFDLDSPGQYMRRLKTVSITIPCVTGPYTGVHCKLSLIRSSIRTSALLGEQYERTAGGEDSRFRDFSGAIESIVTSSGQNDSGLFETKLDDERYLPFEGAGAISTWRLELANDIPQFDFETMSDVILHLRYTAREAGHLRKPASDHVRDNVLAQPDTLLQLLCLPHDFGDRWYAFVTASDSASRTLSLGMSRDHFPYWVKPLGMSNTLVATFSVIDWANHKLSVAPALITLVGDAEGGWTLDIGQGSLVFPFLESHMHDRVYMTVSYMGLPMA